MSVIYIDGRTEIPFSAGTLWQSTLAPIPVNKTVALGGYRNSTALDLCGSAASGSTSELERMGGWKYTVDLSAYKKMRVFAKKIANYGIMYMGVDLPTSGALSRDSAAGRKFVHYNDYPTDWNLYELDVSAYSGSHIIYLLGAWFDSTGGTAGVSRYSNVELI
jgi:hypothetical protein